MSGWLATLKNVKGFQQSNLQHAICAILMRYKGFGGRRGLACDNCSQGAVREADDYVAGKARPDLHWPPLPLCETATSCCNSRSSTACRTSKLLSVLLCDSMMQL